MAKTDDLDTGESKFGNHKKMLEFLPKVNHITGNNITVEILQKISCIYDNHCRQLILCPLVGHCKDNIYILYYIVNASSCNCSHTQHL